jgi:hypothetical protein
MLSVGIKNSILLLLIILILHFLIKNGVMDKGVGITSSVPPTLPSVTSSPPPPPSSTKTEPPTSVKSGEHYKDDLLKFVFDDDKQEKQLEKFFDPQAQPPFPDDKTLKPDFPLACNTLSLMEEPKEELKLPKEIEKPSIGNYLVVNEYKDESVLNGGDLMKGLSGYDEFDDHFQSYECGKK